MFIFLYKYRNSCSELIITKDKTEFIYVHSVSARGEVKVKLHSLLTWTFDKDT